MVNSVSGKDSVKFYLYSGHDLTCQFSVFDFLCVFTVLCLVLPLLVGFTQSDIKWPPYASLMAIELYRATDHSGQFAVRVVYNGRPLNLSFCNGHSNLCPWSLFKDYLGKLIPEPGFCDG